MIRMLQALSWAALGTGFTFLMTTLGAAVVFFFVEEPRPQFQRAMLGFAAGVMTAAAVWSLLIPAIEEAEAMKALMEEFGLTQQELAQKLGKARSSIANSLRLLELHPEVKKLVDMGSISAGHARAILSIDEPEMQIKLARQAAASKLSVRQVESMARQHKLNNIYKVIKEQLSEKKYEIFKNQEISWLDERDKKAEDNAKKFEGMDFAQVEYNLSLAKLTKERCYKLVNEYLQ